ncbi:MAG TPA: GNAT family N-acetyltransferase [Streptosporangiaceae bacterium]
MDRAKARVRPYRPADIDALYQICLLTGDRGRDATSLYRDPRLLGHCFAAPYGLFEPSLAFVAEDTSGVAGYVIGALDSQAFEKRLDSNWWPRLRSRYPEPQSGLPAQQWTPDQQLAHFIHHPGRTPDDLAARYPSHLHIDLLPRLQGRGYGRKLIQTLTTALRDQGSSGVHLNVTPGNEQAVSFYRHVGFTELPAADTRLFVMDLRNTG